ncbi:hypothetical protein C8R44DRAFT_978396 [Mycena epipterygia]|nr:hypothetical protein C8R44DRAFT_978396 [Mycena epipterygia]
MPFSRTPQEEVADAVSARLKHLSFTFTKPIASKQLWTKAGKASDAQRAALIRTARHELNNCYHVFMHSTDHSIGAYEIIQQGVFTQRSYGLMVKHSDLKIDTQDESDGVLSDLFLSFVGVLRQCLDDSNFTSWFIKIFGPLIETGDLALKHATSDSDSDSDSEDESDEPPSKRAKMQPERKYARAYELLRIVYDHQRDFLEHERDDEPAEEDVARMVGGATQAQQGTQDHKDQDLQRRDDAQRRNTLVSRTSTYLSRAASGFLAHAASSTVSVYSAFPSVSSFAPRLNPRPLAMPGAWSTTRPLVSLRPDPAPVFRQPMRNRSTDEYSPFARRAASSSYTIRHICPPNL